MDRSEDHDKLADQLEQDSNRMQQRSTELKHEISDVRDDWQRKRRDGGVPGADPPAATDPPPRGDDADEDDADSD
ncbi:MAG: hypothetical protein ACR2NR_07570 [Solirubrobacteraceae bacterium]